MNRESGQEVREPIEVGANDENSGPRQKSIEGLAELFVIEQSPCDSYLTRRHNGASTIIFNIIIIIIIIEFSPV